MQGLLVHWGHMRVSHTCTYVQQVLVSVGLIVWQHSTSLLDASREQQGGPSINATQLMLVATL